MVVKLGIQAPKGSMSLESKSIDDSILEVSSRKSELSDPSTPVVSLGGNILSDSNLSVEDLDETVSIDFSELSDDIDLHSPPAEMQELAFARPSFEEIPEISDKGIKDVSRKSEEKMLIDIQKKLHEAVKTNSDLIQKIMKLDIKCDFIKNELKELNEKKNGCAECHLGHINTQIKQCEKHLNSLEIQRDIVINELKTHKSILTEYQNNLRNSMDNLDPKIKLKQGVKEGIVNTLKVARDTSTVVEKLDGIRHFNRSGKLIKEYQHSQREAKMRESILSEIKEILAKKNENLETFTPRIQNRKKLIDELEYVIDNVKERVDEIDDLLITLKKTPEPSADILRDIERLEAEKAQKDGEITHYKNKIAGIEKDIADLEKSKKGISKEVLSLNISIKTMDHELKMLEFKMHDIKKELTEELKNGILVAGVETLSTVIDTVNYINIVGLYATQALIAIELAASVAHVAEPVFHVADMVIPILALPFGIYEVVNSGFEYNDIRKHAVKLKKIHDVAKSYKKRGMELKAKLDLKGHEMPGAVPGRKFDPKLEKLRLKENIKYQKLEVGRLQVLLNIRSNEFVENQVKTSTPYLDFERSIKESPELAEDLKKLQTDYVNNEISKFKEESPLKKEIEDLQVSLRNNQNDLFTGYYENPEIDLKLEIMRLQENVKYQEIEILRLEQMVEMQGIEFIENQVKQLPDYLELEHSIENTSAKDPQVAEILIRQRDKLLHDELIKFKANSSLHDEIKELKEKLTENKEMLAGYEKVDADLHKAKILKGFVLRQGLRQGNKFIDTSLNFAAGGFLIGAGVAGIVTATGVASTGGVPVTLILGGIATGLTVTAFVERGAFNLSNRLYDAYQGSKEEFDKTEAGIMYNIGMFIREEQSQPSTENPITDCVFSYLGVKDPHRFIQKVEEKAHTKAKREPKYAEYISAQNKVIIQA